MANDNQIEPSIPESMDPLEIFLSDPESHLLDILHIYFRTHKKHLPWGFLQQSLKSLNSLSSDTLHFADVGASMGFDALYLMNRPTDRFRKPLSFDKMSCSFVEGDEKLIKRGEATLKSGPHQSQSHHCLGEDV